MTAEQPGPRVGQQEREGAVAALADHYSSGRLSGDEYSQRVARAWEARTAPELAALFADLPDPRACNGGGQQAASGYGGQQAPGGYGYGGQQAPGYPPPGGQQAPGGYPPAMPPQQQWPGPGMPGMDPSAPFGREPMTGRPYSDKQRIVAGLLQIFLPFGIGRFYTGHTGIAVAQLIVTIVTFGIGGLWGFIDGIIILTSPSEDANGYPLRP